MMAHRIRVLAAVGVAAGCVDDAIGPSPEPPRIELSRVVSNPANVLSTAVVVRASAAESLTVLFAAGDGPFDQATPTVGLSGDSALVPVLGLRPETRYRAQVLALGARDTAAGVVHHWTTGSLPADLPRFVASGSAPAPGYVVMAAGLYGLVIDNAGRVVWYHRFPDGPGLNFMAQPTGHYYARPATLDPDDRDPWVAIDVLGNQVRTVGCAGGLTPRFHDLIARVDGSVWLMCDDTRPLDLRAIGGSADARVTATAVQHLAATGDPLFEWSPFDHYQLSELDPAARAGAAVNWTHGNAIDLDRDGHLVISFRNLSEIAKIHTGTGEVLWRLGGPGNQFTVANATSPLFHRQHGLRVVDGAIVLLDNLGEPAGSRVERYRYDVATRTVWLDQAINPESPVTALVGGTTQPLPNGHTLAAYGNGGRVEEYDRDGRVVWRIAGNIGYPFRAQRIASLYSPGAAIEP